VKREWWPEARLRTTPSRKADRPTTEAICAECGAITVSPNYVPAGWSLRRDNARLCVECTHKNYLRLVPEADPVTGKV
jgi:hypothetical protein